jgi:adenylate cyclase class 2
MQIEYEATYPNINKDQIRERLKKAGAKLTRSEFMQKREVFNLPKGHEVYGGWLRVRDEGDKVTLSYKIVDNRKDDRNIENQKELCLTIDSFEAASAILSGIGCRQKAYQETKREIWMLDEVEICIDEWPYLEPFVEVEGKSENDVKNVSEKLGFDYSKALFCSVDTLYAKKYGFAEDVFNNQTPLVTFHDPNPFV